jgi:hypothetical protein
MKKRIFNNKSIEHIHKDLIESWKLWLTWFMWFFGINFLCVGWLITTANPYVTMIAAILLVYHVGGIIASFGLAYHTYKISKLKTRNTVFGFPIKLAAFIALLSGVNLIVQACFWITFL